MERISETLKDKIVSAQQAAGMIRKGMCLGCSGFTLVGYPILVPQAIAALGQAGELSILTGASVGDALDGALVRAGMVKFRTPYQSNKELRGCINAGETGYNDMHLSHLPAMIDRKVGPSVDFAVVECAAVSEEGILLGLSVGTSDCFIRNADKIILEVNTTLPLELYGIHDIFTAADGRCVDIHSAADRIGTALVPCDPSRIAAIVVNDKMESYPSFKEPDAISQAIAANIVQLLKNEVAAGRQPASLRPLQSGVGNVANAVLAGLGKDFSDLSMYTEVMQDSAFRLVQQGIITKASTTALSLSKACQEELFRNIDFYRERIVVRPQEISNHPEVIRRLQLISLNTPIEVDIYGNVNSTHVMGTKVMNGIGGSGDFARNAGLTVFATGSLAKNGDISCIVPMCSHVDHTEHDVDVIVTEYGIADLRWKSPRERAELIINNCAHPDYRAQLLDYFHRACMENSGHTPHILGEALSWHDRFVRTGTMKKG